MRGGVEAGSAGFQQSARAPSAPQSHACQARAHARARARARASPPDAARTVCESKGEPAAELRGPPFLRPSVSTASPRTLAPTPGLREEACTAPRPQSPQRRPAGEDAITGWREARVGGVGTTPSPSTELCVCRGNERSQPSQRDPMTQQGKGMLGGGSPHAAQPLPQLSARGLGPGTRRGGPEGPK